jgi:hypothetical protein
VTRSRTLEALTQADPTTLRFSPHGLLGDRVMRAEASAEYLHASIVRAELSAAVPEDVRRSFDRVRQLHMYGLFKYGFFTLADHASWVLPESALGVRFIERYSGCIPFGKGDLSKTLETDSFASVVEAVGSRGRFSRKNGWRLVGHGSYGSGRFFDASYWALLQWARLEGLLRPWLEDSWSQAEDQIRGAVLGRIRPPEYAVPDDWDALDETSKDRWWCAFRRDVWEGDQLELLVRMRNHSAHAPAGHLVMPPDSARSIHAVAGFINSLWPEAESSGAAPSR